MYPLRFLGQGEHIEHQVLLTPEGSFTDVAIPEEYREQGIQLSAVDVNEPDLVRFPKYAKAKTMSCQLGPGDCVWLPSFWWHSSQLPTAEENMAISFSFGAKSLKGAKVNDTSKLIFDLEGGVWTTHRELRGRAKHQEL